MRRGAATTRSIAHHELAGKPGQIDVAKYYRALLAGSQDPALALEGDDRVQDRIACDASRRSRRLPGPAAHAADVLLREANAVDR